MTSTTPRPLVVFDIDGTVMDTRPSFDRIVRERSGATEAEMQRFRDTGGFNDDWDLTRALLAWIGAGRPNIVERCSDLKEVLLWCEHDPGDLSDELKALYRGTASTPGYVADETPLLPPGLLQALTEVADVAVCTGRDEYELRIAEQVLGFVFPPHLRTSADDVKKPDPRALLRLINDEAPPPSLVFFGDTAADRQTVERAQLLRPSLPMRFEHVGPHPGDPAITPIVQALLASLS